jgi:hypothetical protein
MSIINEGQDNYERSLDSEKKEQSEEEVSVKLYRADSGNSADFFFNRYHTDTREENKEKEMNNFSMIKKVSENELIKNETSHISTNLPLREKIEKILSNLYKAYELNKANQKNLIKYYEYLTYKQTLIEGTLDKIKRVNRTKQKKHVKYLRYIPLNKVYFYSPKKNHFYYILMDIVIKSRKKHSLGGNNYSNVGYYDEEDDERVNSQSQSQSMAYSFTNKSTSARRNSTLDNSSKINKSTLKRTINRYKFNEEEDEILKKLILYSGGDYIDWHQIARDHNDFISHVLVRGDKDKLKVRSALECYTRSLELSDFYTYKKWTNNEDQILKKAILYYGPKNWQQISYCLEGRNNSQAFHRWMKGINPKIKRSKWSFEEDLTLGIALKIYGNKKWSKIANHLGGRTDIQCRERFCNILDPSLEEVEWKPHEDAKLLLLYDKMKNKWSKIAKEFGNRTDNTCWRRWKYLESIRKSVGMSNIHTGAQAHGSYSFNNSITNNTHTILESYSEAGVEYTGTYNNYSQNQSKLSSKKKAKKKEIFKVRKMSRSETNSLINN